MEIFFDFSVRLLAFLDDLYLFFFTPLADLLAVALSRLEADGLGATVIEAVLTFLFNLNPIFRDFTLIEFILGSGIILFLLIRLVVFLLPIAE